MYIEPVSAFEYLRVTRSGGIAGELRSLQVSDNLSARVDHPDDVHNFQLDALTAQELMVSLGTLAARGASSGDDGAFDAFQYDIELGWNGKVYRFNAVELAADEALHGVISTTNRLLDSPPGEFHIMSLHTSTHA